MFLGHFFCGLFLTLLILIGCPPAFAQVSEQSGDEYVTRIQPIFNRRCVACHSCMNSPCQLNLQSYSGFSRGAHKLNVYDSKRLQSVEPTRLDIDATTTADWRRKGFFDVNGGPLPDRNLLLKLLNMRRAHPNQQPSEQVFESKSCPVSTDAAARDENALARLSMPYGFPPLSDDEINTLTEWIGRGAPGPSITARAEATALTPAAKPIANAWEQFLNIPEPRQRLVSRYLYEHLFLAHFYIADEPRTFYRLVRSRTPCDQGISEIATRRPTDKPDRADFAYCLRRIDSTIAEKTHLPYELSTPKLERIKQIFFSEKWRTSRLPSFSLLSARNPFRIFADIPVRARYQFLLDDVAFHISTFTKGPSCSGSVAVSSIQEQFFVFFLAPEADPTIASTLHETVARNILALPGDAGSDISIIRGHNFLKKLAFSRDAYRKLRNETMGELRPNGLALSDIWDGNGGTLTAVVTIMRHLDNASVFPGAVGDVSKTAFVLDYALFERLIYTLVVNFDVFGDAGHQLFSRLYMDMLRVEGEEQFLSFLPPSKREALREQWYRGGLITDLKRSYFLPLLDTSRPSAVTFRDENDAQREFFQQVLFERLSSAARGPVDALNWKALQPPASVVSGALSPIDQAFRKIASIKAVAETPFARHMPDLAVVLVRLSNGGLNIYSIAHHVEHENVAWIADEGKRLAPEEDTLTVRAGLLGNYPNIIFSVDESEIDAFTSAIAALRSSSDYNLLRDRYAIERTDERRFWQTYDALTALHDTANPITAGIIDLTRYEKARR